MEIILLLGALLILAGITYIIENYRYFGKEKASKFKTLAISAFLLIQLVVFFVAMYFDELEWAIITQISIWGYIFLIMRISK